MAREELCRRAPSREVQDVHADQGHERSLARAAGGAVLQTRDRASLELPEAEEQRSIMRTVTANDMGQCYVCSSSGFHDNLWLFYMNYSATNKR